MMFGLVAILGVVAGLVTTSVGIGGGMILVIALSFFLDIQTVLAMTAPALLVGNVGRIIMLRRDVHARTAMTFAAGAIPGVVLGAVLLVQLSDTTLRWALAAMVIAYVVSCVATEIAPSSPVRARLGNGGLAGAGVACGVVATSVGGGGLVLAPALRGRQLEREGFVATAAAVATAIHLTRVASYGVLGVSSGPIVVLASVLSGAVLVGNSLGRRILGRLSPRGFRFGLLFVIVLMAVALVVRI